MNTLLSKPIGIFIEKYFKIFCIAAIAFQYFVFLFYANRGLDLSDEAFYYVNYKNVDAANFATSKFQVLFSKFFFFVDINFVSLRILSLHVVLLSSVSIGFSAHKLLVYKNMLPAFSRMEVVGIISSFSLLAFGFGPRTFSYNYFNTSFISVYFFALLYFYVHVKTVSILKLKTVVAFLFCIISILYLSFINKATTSIILALITIPFLFLLRKDILKHYSFLKISTTILLATALVFVIFSFALFHNLSGLFTFLFNSIEANSHFAKGAYNTGIAVKILLDFLGTMKIFITKTNSLVIIFLLIFYWLKNEKYKIIILSFLLIILLYMRELAFVNYDVFVRFHLIYDLFFIGAIILIAEYKILKQRLIFLLPPLIAFAGYLGTSVTFAIHVCFYATFAAAFFLFYYLKEKTLANYLLLILIISFNANTFFSSIKNYPYKAEAMNLCTEKINVDGHDLYVTKSIVDFNSKLKSCISNRLLINKKYIFNSTQYFAAPFLLQKSVPIIAWADYKNDEFNKFMVSKIEKQKLYDCLFLLNIKIDANTLTDTNVEKLVFVNSFIYKTFKPRNDTVCAYYCKKVGMKK